MDVIVHLPVLLGDIHGDGAGGEGDAVCKLRLRVVALKLDGNLDKAGVHVFAAAVAALGHVPVRLEQLPREDDERIYKPGEEPDGVEKAEGSFMNEKSCRKQGHGETDYRAGGQLLRGKAPREQYPEQVADDEGAQYGGEFRFLQEKTSPFFVAGRACPPLILLAAVRRVSRRPPGDYRHRTRARASCAAPCRGIRGSRRFACRPRPYTRSRDIQTRPERC